MISDIAGVILAGGENKRFGGRSKTEILVGGKTIFSRMTGTLREIFEEIIIVTNDPDKYKEAGRFKITGDVFLNKGPGGGVHAAMKISSKKALFIFAGDMPFLEKQLITRQIDIFSGSGSDALVPLTGEHIEPLHSIYRTSLIGKLEKYLSDSENPSMHGFISEIDVHYLNMVSPENATGSFININTPSELADIEKTNRLPGFNSTI
jgi:molybdopterin-guanine dinucleotide biosynthesis protein A